MDNGIEYRVQRLENQIDRINDSINELSNSCVGFQKDNELITQKLSNLEKHTEAIINMTYEFRNLSNQVSNVIDIIEKHENKLETQGDEIESIKGRPASTALKTIILIGSTIITSICGMLVGHFFK